MKEAMQQMLQDFIDQFVKNPESRSKTEKSCTYNPSDPYKSPGCAIGMYLDYDVAEKLDKYNAPGISSIFNDKNRKCLLPKWMQQLDIEFLKELQSLHDSSFIWISGSFGPLGKSRMANLCAEHGLDYKSLKF